MRKERLKYMFISSLWFLWTPFIAIVIMGLVVDVKNNNPVYYTVLVGFAFLTFVSAMIYQSVKIIKETKDDK